MPTFKELVPQQHWAGGYHGVANFPNGYGVSVLCNAYSYGGNKGLFELAVLHGEELCYTTDISEGDVRGWLTAASVRKLIAEVKALPRNERCTHRRAV